MPDLLTPENRPFTLRPGSPAERTMYCRDLVLMDDGPTGSGKSRPALEKAYFCASHWPGTRVLLLRKAKAHAASTIMQTWESQVVPSGDPAGVLQSRNYKSPAYTFSNGSYVAVDGMYDGSGYNQAVMGTEWDIVICDEGTQFSEDDGMRLIGRLNRIAPTPERIPFNQILFTCNPEAPSHWLWRWHLAGKLTRIPSQLEDNPVFHDGKGWTPQGLKYLATVDKYTGVMRARNRFGLWVGAEGMIYDEWSDANIIDTMPPGSEDWWRVRSIDFGFREPFVCLWLVVDPNGRIYVEREYVRCHKTVSKHAPELKRLTPDEGLIQFTVADHDAEDRATLAEHDIDTVPAIKPRKDSDWAAHFDPIKRRLMPAADGFPRLFVLRDAVKRGGGPEPLLGNKPCGIIEEITSYQWEEPKPDKASRERPNQVNDHSCFVAGTMVETETGARAIETIRAGDRVWTRAGLRPVEFAGSVGERDVWRLESEAGTLEGTADHPIFVVGRGMIRMDALRYADMILAWKQTAKSSRSTGSGTAAIPTAPTDRIGCITPPARGAGPSACTLRSGSMRTVPCLTGTTFTTGTATRSTMTSGILNASPVRSIIGTMPPTSRPSNERPEPATLIRSGTLPSLGTHRRRDGSGIGSTLRLSRTPQSPGMLCVSGAGRVTKANCPSGSVAQTAAPAPVASPALTTRPESADGAISRLKSTDTPRSVTVPARVLRVQPSGRREPVYNLTVAGDHEYFANGVLVSNCDALRYACLAIDRWFDGEAEKDKPAYEEGTIGEALGLNDEEDDA